MVDADVVIVGAGLAGLVAARELAEAGRRVIIVDQEPEASLGGQAFWSFGGLFLVNSPEQRRLGIRDSHELALQDWMGSAGYDREEDFWPRQWAQAYVAFAAGEKRAWLHSLGIRIFPVVGWAERGGYEATEHGNTVPRFHVAWGTGPGVLEPFLRSVRESEKRGLVTFRFRHRVSGIRHSGSSVEGVHGEVLDKSDAIRGAPSSRSAVRPFELRAQAVIVTSGGMGGNHDLVRRYWPKDHGAPPRRMLQGVPDSVDGSMLAVLEEVGGRLVNLDRMWHYPEGIQNYAPVWNRHGIRILSGPSPFWLDAGGRRLPTPLFPGFDSLGALRRITSSGSDYSWFVLNQRIIRKEFALSGSEQNPDLASRSLLRVARSRRGRAAPAPVEAFKERGEDFVMSSTLAELVRKMNELAGADLIDVKLVEQETKARDAEADNRFGKDAQMTAIRGARAYLGDRLIRVARPHRLLDPEAGPLIAVRLRILTRKTLGGVQTDLESRVLDRNGKPIAGLYAAGEVAGFGGGGLHGYRALEGTFLGGCLFSGRSAGRAAAKAIV
jgi:predicted oxidoreductase